MGDPAGLSARVRSTSTTTLPNGPWPSFMAASSVLIAATVLSITLPICRHDSAIHGQPTGDGQGILDKGQRLGIQRSGLGEIAQHVRVCMMGAALRQNPVDRAFGLLETRRLAGPTPSTTQVPPRRTVRAVSAKLFSL